MGGPRSSICYDSLAFGAHCVHVLQIITRARPRSSMHRSRNKTRLQNCYQNMVPRAPGRVIVTFTSLVYTYLGNETSFPCNTWCYCARRCIQIFSPLTSREWMWMSSRSSNRVRLYHNRLPGCLEKIRETSKYVKAVSTVWAVGALRRNLTLSDHKHKNNERIGGGHPDHRCERRARKEW